MIRFSAGICKGCGRSIIWIQTPSKKSMPCDPDEKAYRKNPKGRDSIMTRNGEAVRCDIIGAFQNYSDADGIGYVPHWATCPNADQFRRRKA